MRVFVLFNLKPGVTREDYEAWARSTDLPVVNGMRSVADFRIFRALGLLGSDAPSPYAYVETIDIDDMDDFGAELAKEQMQRVASEFHTFADAPIFIRADTLT